MADSTSQLHSHLNDDARSGSTLEGHRIADTIARFAAGLQQTDADPRKLATSIVEGAVKLIPAADFATVRRLVGKRHLEMDMSTDDDIPWQLMDLQNAMGEGPCLDAILGGTQIHIADMTTEPRWPQFSPAAAELGVIGVLSTPMELRDHTSGCLALISMTTAFDDEALSMARIFATHAGIALSGAIRHESLTTALSTREIIGQAKGILMERFKMTDDEAFAALVKASADNNLKLRTVCAELCRTGALPTSSTRHRNGR